MKPAAFGYFAPNSLDQALDLLARYGADGKILAGGQSLVPAMNFRLARPAVLIDINRLTELEGISLEPEIVRVGALTRHAIFETSVVPNRMGKFLRNVVRHIAHPPIRWRGTMGGSLAHADPASEWCCIALLLDAELVGQDQTRQYVIPARDFFTTIFTTALAEDQILVEVRLPKLGDEWGFGFCEFSRRAGDFALSMAACRMRIEDHIIADARIALGGVAPTPILATPAADMLIGKYAEEALFSSAAREAVARLTPLEDIHASSEYRRDLTAALIKRALVSAASQ